MKSIIHNKASGALIIAILYASVCFGQSVAINADGSLSSPSAILDVKSSDKGLLMPRLSAAEKDAVVQPATGLIIFQKDASAGFYYNKGTTIVPNWVALQEKIEPVAFSVKSNAVVVTPQTGYVFAQTQEEYDVSNNFLLNGSLFNPNTFLVPYNGIYHFDASVIWTISPGENYYGYTEIRVNGNTKMSTYNWMHDDADMTTHVSTDLKLNAGDKITLGLKHTSANPVTIFGSFFSGHLLFKF